MSGLGIFGRQGVGNGLGLIPAEAPPASAAETIGASFDAESIRGNMWAMRQRRRIAIFEALAARLELDAVPFTAFRAGQDSAYAQQLLSRAASAAAENPGAWADIPTNLESLDARVDFELKFELGEAEAVTRRAEGLGGAAAQFAGAAAAWATDPPSLAMAYFGLGAQSLGRRILLEAGLGAVGEAAALPRIVEMEERLGLEPSDPFLQMAAGAAFGASLPIAGAAAGQARRLAAGVSNSALVRAARARATALNPVQRAAAVRLQTAEDDATINPGVDPDIHAAAMDRAEAAIARGDAALLPDVNPPSGAAPIGSLEERMIRVESGGRTDAQNPNSTARGVAQYTEATWLESVQRHAPELTEGRSRAEVLALRDDATLSRRILKLDNQQRRAWLTERGLPANDGEIYLAHFAGLGGAERTLRAAPNAPISGLMSAEAITANANIRHRGKAFPEWTAGDLVDWARTKMNGAQGATIGELSLPSEMSSVAARDVLTDARRFQYRTGADAEGVTERLLSETTWDRRRGAGLTFWQADDGRLFVADGHQRAGLARRLAEQGQSAVTLQGYVLREADGWTPELARATAAMINMRNEAGDAFDVGDVLKRYPELAGEIDRGRRLISQNERLAGLARVPFLQVMNGELSEGFGAVIGRVSPSDEAMQSAIQKAFRELEPENTLQADMIARDVRRIGMRLSEENGSENPFGDSFNFRAQKIGERAKIMDRAVRLLQQNRAVFNEIGREAARLEELVNVYGRSAKENSAAFRRSAVRAILATAEQPGFIRDTLADAVDDTRLRSVDAVARDFASALIDAVESGEFGSAVDLAYNARAADAARAGGGDPWPDPGPVDEVRSRIEEAGETPRELFADPVSGPGARAETATLEDDIIRRGVLTEVEASAPVILDRDQGPRSRADVLAELKADAEFIKQLSLCRAGGG